MIYNNHVIILYSHCKVHSTYLYMMYLFIYNILNSYPFFFSCLFLLCPVIVELRKISNKYKKDSHLRIAELLCELWDIPAVDY